MNFGEMFEVGGCNTCNRGMNVYARIYLQRSWTWCMSEDRRGFREPDRKLEWHSTRTICFCSCEWGAPQFLPSEGSGSCRGWTRAITDICVRVVGITCIIGILSQRRKGSSPATSTSTSSCRISPSKQAVGSVAWSHIPLGWLWSLATQIAESIWFVAPKFSFPELV